MKTKVLVFFLLISQCKFAFTQDQVQEQLLRLIETQKDEIIFEEASLSEIKSKLDLLDEEKATRALLYKAHIVNFTANAATVVARLALSDMNKHLKLITNIIFGSNAFGSFVAIPLLIQ